MNPLVVKKISKKYPNFSLKDVSFSLEPGTITGFIGRNGAGKTTTIKSLINFVHPDNGEILFFDKDFNSNELEIKQKIGIVFGGINFYPQKEIKKITKTTKRFYHQWDQEIYQKYLNKFNLDENKKPSELSEGMKVKYSLTLALSHHAEILILDEPTSGLDPVSREDLLDIFLDLKKQGTTILFSTHIISDLEKCADKILYLKNGEIIADSTVESFLKKFKIVNLSKTQLEKISSNIIGIRPEKDGYSALIETSEAIKMKIRFQQPTLESIMVHIENNNEKITL